MMESKVFNFFAKKCWFILLAALVLIGCVDNTVKEQDVPTHILKKEELTAFLFEYQILEAAKSTRSIAKKPSNELMANYYAQIAEKSGYTKEQFTESYKWWANHPHEMEQIWQEVLNRIESKEKEESKFTDQ